MRNPDTLRDNRLLGALRAADRAVVQPHLEELDLQVRHSVYQAGEPIEYVYFPHGCVISVHIRMDNGMAVETAAVGREGFVGLPVFLGTDRTTSTAFCQVPGRASRIKAGAFRTAVNGSTAINALFLRYTQSVLTQVSQTAACNRAHTVEERCARWLLMIHDQVEGGSFSFTQEFLAEMLGVRRPRVSVAASTLARAGLIAYSRGRVRILDRPGLEAAACECYQVIAREYTRLFNEPSIGR